MATSKQTNGHLLQQSTNAEDDRDENEVQLKSTRQPKETTAWQETRLGPQKEENQALSNDERQNLLPSIDDKNWKNCYKNSNVKRTYIGIIIVTCVSLVIAISCGIVLGVKKNIYAQDGLSISTVVGNMDTVFLLEYDPHIISSLKLDAQRDTGNTIRLYNITCDSFENETEYINQTISVNLTSGEEIHNLQPLYLIKGSKLQYNFKITLESPEKSTQITPCTVDVNLFANYQNYKLFLIDPTSSIPLKSYCLTSGQLSYTVTALGSTYLFQALRIYPGTTIRSITYKVEGYVYYYDTTGKRPDCMLEPEFHHQCTFFPSTKEKTCVFAATSTENYTTVTHTSNLASSLQTERTALIVATSLLAGCALGGPLALLKVAGKFSLAYNKQQDFS